MRFLLLRALWKLIYFDFFLVRGDFPVVHEEVRNCRVGASTGAPDVTQRICAAVDVACIWYWKEVLCLQRSAATACLLRRYGVPAQMMIGVQQLPFKAHAWVEVDGQVINDKSYMRDVYTLLDQC